VSTERAEKAIAAVLMLAASLSVGGTLVHAAGTYVDRTYLRQDVAQIQFLHLTKAVEDLKVEVQGLRADLQAARRAEPGR
jgi:hypothetical protein